jgi:hypothetical protein
LAEALIEWLPLVLPYTKPWVSKSDIQSGERWSISIANELQDSNFGIICVTRDNLTAPWILFEAGAIAKSMEDGRLIPLLLDLDFKEISGPLAQFQAKKADLDGIKELVLDLNKVAPTKEPEDRLILRFDPLYSWIQTKINEIPVIGPQKPTRSQGEILEELVAGVRNVEMRVRDAMDDDPSFRRRVRRRFSPGMLMDLTHSLSDGPDDPIQTLIFFSMFREDAPWLYELALEYFRAVSEKDRDRARKAQSRLRRAVEMVRHSPLLEMMGSDKMLHMMMFEAREFIPSLSRNAFEDDGIEIEKRPKVRIRRPPTPTKDRDSQ